MKCLINYCRRHIRKPYVGPKSTRGAER